jgi:signal transduction histidine kinase
MERLQRASVTTISISTIVLVATLILGAFGAYTYKTERDAGRERLRGHLYANLAQLADGLSLPVWTFDKDQIRKIVSSAARDPEIQFVRLDTGDETYSAGTHPGGTAPWLHASQEISYGGHATATLEIFATSAQLDRNLRRGGFRVGILILFTDLVLIASLYTLLWNTILRPLREVEAYAKSASEEGGERAPSRTVLPREIESLRSSVERMAALQERRYREARVSKERAEAADRQKAEFLDIAAHELRTPLTPLSLLLEMVENKSRGSTAHAPEIWGRINMLMDRLTRIIAGMIEIGRIDTGGFVLHPRETDLAGLLGSVVQEFRAQSPGRLISLSLDGGDAIAQLDPERIRQVLGHLLDNAAKYTPEHSPIEVSLRHIAGSRARITVRDHGPGISAERQKTLFTRFFRVMSGATLRHSGLGLGLYTCSRILDMHHGSIGVECRENEGSEFFFELPLERRAA